MIYHSGCGWYIFVHGTASYIAGVGSVHHSVDHFRHADCREMLQRLLFFAYMKYLSHTYRWQQKPARAVLYDVGILHADLYMTYRHQSASTWLDDFRPYFKHFVDVTAEVTATTKPFILSDWRAIGFLHAARCRCLRHSVVTTKSILLVHSSCTSSS